MIEAEVLTALLGIATTAGGVVVGRRLGAANASKVEAEALEIAARAYDAIVATHARLNASLGAQLDRVTGELGRVTSECEKRDHANALRHAAAEARMEQLEEDNSSLRAELMALELLDTEDVLVRRSWGPSDSAG